MYSCLQPVWYQRCKAGSCPVLNQQSSPRERYYCALIKSSLIVQVVMKNLGSVTDALVRLPVIRLEDMDRLSHQLIVLHQSKLLSAQQACNLVEVQFLHIWNWYLHPVVFLEVIHDRESNQSAHQTSFLLNLHEPGCGSFIDLNPNFSNVTLAMFRNRLFLCSRKKKGINIY